MWRRVLSQSPSSVPQDAKSDQQTRDYLDGWRALGALLHSGGALSGHERNVCFLNTGSSRFADASGAARLDMDADSRGLAIVDWDGDGDLDVWLTNRTSPRVAYLENQLDRHHHYISLRLRGVRCNRDAVGARVEVVLEDSSAPRLVQSLAAGEGFVSQGSKWVHFGLGNGSRIKLVRVRWPGGVEEDFHTLESDKRYELVQGSGDATVVTPVPVRSQVKPVKIAESTADSLAEGSSRLVLPQRLPMPTIHFRTLEGQVSDSQTLVGKPVVWNLWATWCQPCLVELSEWSQQNALLDESRCAVRLLNVDFAEEEPSNEQLVHVREVHARLKLPFAGSLVDGSQVEILESIERSLSLFQLPLPIPTTFLVDAEGRLAVVYKGPVSAKQLLADLESLDRKSSDPRDRAIPFSGRWLTSPFPPDLLSIPSHFIGLGRTNEAYDYLHRYVLPETADPAVDAWSQLGVTSTKLVKVLQNTAKGLLSAGQADEALELLQKARLYQPNNWDLHVELSSLLIQLGKAREALEVSQHMAALRKNHPLPFNNIAWIMATSDDPTIRKPEEAVKLSERICQATRYQEPSALDTLAVAYAAAGRYDDAIKTAEKAIARCRELQIPELGAMIAKRLELYRVGKAYRPE